uniref:Uncharacterized protein n=1 Tax=Lepeophtheirus salmonis TaxID=72036 RepID=A0A0K2TGF7_LEPSM
MQKAEEINSNNFFFRDSYHSGSTLPEMLIEIISEGVKKTNKPALTI